MPWRAVAKASTNVAGAFVHLGIGRGFAGDFFRFAAVFDFLWAIYRSCGPA
jgi:hypothetical protein